MPFDNAAADRAATGTTSAHHHPPHVKRLDPRTWLLAVGSFAVATDLLIVPGVLPNLAQGLGVGLEHAGSTMAAYGISYAIGAPVLAVLTARLRTDFMVKWALVGLALSGVIAATAPSFGVLLAARVLAGLSAALYSPSAYAIATHMASTEHRGRALAVVAIGLSASAIGGVPVGLAAASAFGWHAAFWTVSALALVGLAALTIKTLPAVKAPAQLTLAQRLAPLADTKVLITLSPLLLWITGNFAFYTYLGGFLHSHHVDGASVTAYMLMLGAGSVAGSQVAGMVTDRFGPTRPLAVFLGISVINMALLPLSSTNPIALGIALFVFGFSIWSTWTPQQARVIAANPKAAHVTLALTNSVLYGASAIGAGVGASVAAHWSVNELPLVAAAFSALAIAVIAASAVRNRPRLAAA